MDSADDIIARLGLEPLAHEGGWFKRLGQGPTRADGRPEWSLIHALYTVDGFSALHRLRVDETWTFLGGDPLELYLIEGDGSAKPLRLGFDKAAGELAKVHVAAGVWQGARPAGAVVGWSLVSCLCVPAFEWDDFELGDRRVLEAAHPAGAEMISRLTR